MILDYLPNPQMFFPFSLPDCYFPSVYGIPGASQVARVVKNLPANAGDIRDMSWIPGLGRSTGEGNGYPLQYSCLENPMDRRPWGLQSIVSQRVGCVWSDLVYGIPSNTALRKITFIRQFLSADLWLNFFSLTVSQGRLSKECLPLKVFFFLS